uniref:Protocadherin 2 alpha a 15 n=1 Tax=Oryzias latipes TaxID=8090 RepID=A0A3P9IJ24_ORYLA
MLHGVHLLLCIYSLPKACVIDVKTVLENPLEVHYVAVEIVDVNDHTPSFPEEENMLEISESALPGAKFPLKAARDADIGSFSVQHYKLSQNDYFRLEVKDRGENRKTPSLVLQKPLDRETVKTHVLLLTAFDGGKPPRSGNMTIIVNVSDVNDNPPVFSQDSYIAHLNENAPVGTTVIQVSATDLDEGSNGEIVYSFGNHVDPKVRELFDLNDITGVITVIGIIDFEVNDKYELDIQASDKGAATLKSHKTVNIVIVDLNDNAPVIEVTSFSRAHPEDSKPGSTVALISVKDSDSGINGKVLCFIDQNLPFTINPSSQNNMYSLVTKQVLDREQQNHYEVIIVAKDAGEPSLSSEKSITVVVSDVNDNVPTFSQNPVNFYIKENNSPGKTILSVTAHDSDEGSNALISYSILRDRDTDNLFTSFLNVNSESGEVLALKSFDFESVKTFQFQVVATDSGSPPLSSNVTVNVFILDQNDNAPVILYPVSSNGSAEGVEEIPRNVNAGHLVTKVRAYDADIGYNVSCSIDKNVPFDLSQSVEDNMFSLVIKAPLDREKQSIYDLTIIAKDAGQPPLSSEKTVSVVISDINDNCPEFSLSPYTFYVNEGNKQGASVFSVKALDRDENDNAVIAYHILTDGREDNKLASFLNINSDSGEIVALKSFDFESVKTFQFHVVATDSGSPPLSSNVTVNVFILDQNDNAPVILYPVSSNGSAEGVEEIPRNVNAGHLVTKVRAYDADIGYNGWLLFSLQQVTDHSLFALDRYTGQIRTLRSFTETDEAEHKLLILVKDNGNVSLSATATVIVKLVEPKEAFAASDVQSRLCSINKKRSQNQNQNHFLTQKYNEKAIHQNAFSFPSSTQLILSLN